jgi:iron-sulfur cluster assembly protein
MSLSLSEKAAREVKRIMTENKLPPQAALRLGVAAGGCSGFEYCMDFDESPDESEDIVSESRGIRIVVDRKSATYLEGLEIDFHEDLLSRNFVFNNPLAVKTCGCGTSFGM